MPSRKPLEYAVLDEIPCKASPPNLGTMQVVATERRPNGTFAKGSSGFAGRRHKTTVRFQEMANEILRDTDWQSIFQALVKHAQNGEIPAIKLLFEYYFGRPVSVEVEAVVAVAPVSFDDWWDRATAREEAGC